jgi:hypothetical protein
VAVPGVLGLVVSSMVVFRRVKLLGGLEHEQMRLYMNHEHWKNTCVLHGSKR